METQRSGAPPLSFDERVTVITRRCALLHTLYSANCLLYVDLSRILEVLETELVVGDKHRFTPKFCVHFVWQVICEEKDFFAIEVTEDDWKGGRPTLPNSLLAEITKQLRSRIHEERDTFPSAWCRLASWGGLPRGTTGKGSHQHTLAWHDTTEQARVTAWAGRPATPVGGGGIIRGAGGGSRQKVGPIYEGCRELEHVHPRVSAIMKPYWKMFGTMVRIRPLMEGAGRGWGELPGSQDVCWSHQTGVCGAGAACRRASSHGRHLTDSEAGKLAEVLKTGVAKVFATGAPRQGGHSSGSKRKAGQ